MLLVCFGHGLHCCVGPPLSRSDSLAWGSSGVSMSFTWQPLKWQEDRCTGYGARGTLDSADRYKVLMRFLLQLYNIDISCMLAVALCLRRGQRLRAASSFELNCKMQQQMRRRKAKIKLRHHQQKSKINIIVNDSIT